MLVFYVLEHIPKCSFKVTLVYMPIHELRKIESFILSSCAIL